VPKGGNVKQFAYTIFLPYTNTRFDIYPDLLEEIRQKKCTILRAKEFVAFYAVGWYAGTIYQQGDLVEIYYVISRPAQARLLCVRMSFVSPGYVQAVPMDWLPPGLRPFDEFDLTSRYGRSLRKERFLPRLLPIRVAENA
jgi:hypothetical protein